MGLDLEDGAKPDASWLDSRLPVLFEYLQESCVSTARPLRSINHITSCCAPANRLLSLSGTGPPVTRRDTFLSLGATHPEEVFSPSAIYSSTEKATIAYTDPLPEPPCAQFWVRSCERATSSDRRL